MWRKFVLCVCLPVALNYSKILDKFCCSTDTVFFKRQVKVDVSLCRYNFLNVSWKLLRSPQLWLCMHVCVRTRVRPHMYIQCLNGMTVYIDSTPTDFGVHWILFNLVMFTEYPFFCVIIVVKCFFSVHRILNSVNELYYVYMNWHVLFPLMFQVKYTYGSWAYWKKDYI